MTTDRLQEVLAEGQTILLDGAMGTLLMAAGLEQGAPPEEWNVLHPERIRAAHRAYIEAGSRVILTNSFGGSKFRLSLHKLQDRVFELNREAARLARAEADLAEQTVLVAGSMGPTGQLFEPMGAMTFEEAREAFAEQARGLAAGGADLIWIETMSDVQEVQAAIEGARSACDLPIVSTMSFDTHGRTMMGVTPMNALESIRALDVMALGANCGANLADTEAAVRTMAEAAPDAMLVAKANAGIPHWEADDLVYDGTPTVMADYARRMQAAGARFIGACCGSGPDHIRAMKAALADTSPLPAQLPTHGLVNDEDDVRPRRQRRRHGS